MLELVFQSEGSIWTQAAGEERRNAAAVPTDNQHPDWSPDGTRLARPGATAATHVRVRP